MRIRPGLSHACIRAALALAVGLVAVQGARAQSLIEAWSTTYNSNPDLLASRALLRQTDESLAQAVANWRPRVSLAVNLNKNIDANYPKTTANFFNTLNGKSTTVQLTQPLFLGGTTVANTKQAQANIQAQRALLADTERNVLLAALTAYAAVIQNIAIADASRNNVNVLVQQLDATRERFRVGELTITDVSQSEARLEFAKASLVQSETNVRISEAQYQRTIGVKPVKLGEVPLVGGLPSSEEEAVALAMDGGPLPTNAQYLITAASYGVNSAVGALLPQVNLVGTVQQQFDVVVPGDAYMNYILGIQATIPLYQGGGEWSKIRQAKELVGQRRSNLDSARRLAAQNTITAWRQLDSARSQVTSYEAQVRANEVALNGVRQEALVGSRTTLDVLNAEQELLNSQVNLITARYNVQVYYYTVLGHVGRLTARTLSLPVEYYDEERYYNDVGSRWIGWGNSDSGGGVNGGISGSNGMPGPSSKTPSSPGTANK